jgi:hypothetical protein
VPAPSDDETATQRRQRGAATSMLELSVSSLSPRALVGWWPAARSPCGCRFGPNTPLCLLLHLHLGAFSSCPPGIGHPNDLAESRSRRITCKPESAEPLSFAGMP